MATATLTPEAAVVAQPAVFLLSVDRYQAMIAAGIIGNDDPVELIEGRLLAMMAKNPPHSTGAGLLMDHLFPIMPAGYFLAIERPLAAVDSVPEPDVMIVRGEPDDYPRRPPGPRDVALVVEVANTSFEFDHRTKKRVYARAGVSTYWIVNVPARCLHVFTDPTGPADAPDYRSVLVLKEGESVALFLDGVEVARIAVAELLPRAEG